MFGSEAAVSSGFLGWWWLIPVACIILCIICCRSCGHHMKGRRWCCGRNHRADEISDLRKEVQDLKDKISPAK